MFGPAPTLSSLRRDLETIKRQYARRFAVAYLKPAADQIVEMWNIAIANKERKPTPMACIRKVTDVGFRLHNFNVLHGYMDDCSRYNLFPEALIIVDKLFPPGKKVNLSTVLPHKF